jgi:hypothetical protein
MNDWEMSGIGRPGDSGAGVVDCDTGDVCGLIIGRLSSIMTNGTTRSKALMIDRLDVTTATLKAAKGVRMVEVIKCHCLADPLYLS